MQIPLFDNSNLQNKRFLITGGEGMLARSFTRSLNLLVPTAKVWAPPRIELDVCDAAHVQAASQFEPDFILHCAARVDADFCETNVIAAKTSIVEGTGNIIQLAVDSHAKLLYPQSFLIYDGQENPITETTEPHPLSVYGQLKLEAEQLVLARLPDALVVRMAGFFGGDGADTNFVGKVVPHLAKLISQGKRSVEIGDRVWQPTYTDDLSTNSLALLAAGKYGVFCMASHGEASFFELTQEIVRILGLADKMNVQRIDATSLASREAAKRPMRAVMDNQRLRREGFDLQRPWRVALADYLDSNHFRSMF